MYDIQTKSVRALMTDLGLFSFSALGDGEKTVKNRNI